MRKWLHLLACVSCLFFRPEALPAQDDPMQGWTSNPAGAASADHSILFEEKPSLRIQLDSRSASKFSTVIRSIPIDFAGTKVELRGHLRTDGVTGFAGLWAREDGVAKALEFDNMSSRHLSGTTDWSEYTITLPLNSKATTLFYGVLLNGSGTVWSTQPQLLVDGKPISQAPHVQRLKTVFEIDHEFDNGSHVQIDALSKQQLSNLVSLGEVWGFLKYFHPAIGTGTRHWDYELFRVLPRILKTSTEEAANRTLADWVDSLGAVPPCNPCAAEPPRSETQLPSPVGWIRDKTKLGERLSRTLIHVYENRKPQTQFYTALVPGAGNASFENEPAYDGITFPDSGYQLLAAYRFWAIIQYWYPYRDLIADNWTSVLHESIPDIVQARDGREFDRALLTLIARVKDTHANLWSSLQARPPEGDCMLPVAIRFIDNRPVVTEFAQGNSSRLDLQRGDVITKMDGLPVDDLVKRWAPYFADSNDAAKMRDMGRWMGRGDCAEVGLDVERKGSSVHVLGRRIPTQEVDFKTSLSHDLPGDTFRLLTPHVAYMKLSSIRAADVAGYIESAKATKGLIVDLRGYPKEFVVFALGSLLIDRETTFARFTKPDLSNPGSFIWGDVVQLAPAELHYGGKVVILVDEITQSQAEYTAMALRASQRAVIIGSTTAGADGNVSNIPLPGGRRAAISGIGVFYPDKRPTQQIGIVPDIVMKPTLRGIEEGRDELVERALREIVADSHDAAPSAM